MQPQIKSISEIKMIGISLTMSHVNNRTGELWRSFMPRRREIAHTLGQDLISLQQYDPDYFRHFDPSRSFIKWAGAEVSAFDHLPEGMQTLVIPGGLYAIFLHKGASNDTSTFEYIFSQWLPASDYILAHRPHFERLGARYKNLDPSSEEDIYIPIEPRR